MAHEMEPMDVDIYDDKENSLIRSNVLASGATNPQELDNSEYNMKLRYSMSPMSKSFTNNLNNDNKENANMTQSLNSTITKEVPRSLPLQSITSDILDESVRTANVLRQIDSVLSDGGTLDITVTKPDDDNFSLPSSVSSTVCTPEATTPTKEVLKSEGSPILRGLKSVLNMFRPSQSPIPPQDGTEPLEETQEASISATNTDHSVLASTPLGNKKDGEATQPSRESLVFNEELEKELEWKDDSTIIFSQERIPIHKLLFQTRSMQSADSSFSNDVSMSEVSNANITTEMMDISYNQSMIEKTISQEKPVEERSTYVEPESEKDESVFLDCETTFTKHDTAEDVTQEVNPHDIAEDVTQDVNLHKTDESSFYEAHNETLKTSLQNDSKHVDENAEKQVGVELNEDVGKEVSTAKEIIDNNKVTEASVEVTTEIGHVEKELATETHVNVEKVVSDINEKATEPIVGQATEIIENVMTTATNVVNEKEMASDSKLEIATEDNIEKEITTVTNDIVDIVMNAELSEIIEKQIIEEEINIPVTDKSFSAQTENAAVNEPTVETQAEVIVVDQKPTDIKEVISEALEIEKMGSVDIAFNEETAPITEPENFMAENQVCEIKPIVAEGKEDDFNVNVNENEVIVTKDTSDAITEEITTKYLQDLVSENKSTNGEIDQINAHVDQASNEEISTEIQPEPNTFTIEDTILLEQQQNELIDAQIDVLSDDQTIATESKVDLVAELKQDEGLVSAEIPEVEKQEDVPKDALVECGQDAISAVVEENIEVENAVDINNDIQIINEVTSMVPEMPKPEENITIDKEIRNIIIESQITEAPKDDTIKTGENESTKAENIEQVEAPVDEEIYVSESNSPYVSLNKEDDELAPVAEAHNTNTEVTTAVSPPRSPKLAAKGYCNFNFDECENPFATETKIRQSPPPSLNNSNISPLNVTNKTVREDEELKLDGTMDLGIKSPQKDIHGFEDIEQKNQERNEVFEQNAVISSNNVIENIIAADEEVVPNVDITHKDDEIASLQSPAQNLDLPNINLVSSSEHSDYQSLGSSGDMTTKENYVKELKNPSPIKSSEPKLDSTVVIDKQLEDPKDILSHNEMPIEVNFDMENPFATKSKMRASPPPSLSSPRVEVKSNLDVTAVCESMDISMQDCDKTSDKSAIEQDDNSIVSSRASEDRDVTVREVHTEDEDTMEGPFIEEDLMDDKFANFETERGDIQEFSDVITQENANIDSGEIFIDAQAFDFLMSQSKSNEVINSGKESLFLKFDPLFANRVNSDGVVEALAKVQKLQSTPKKITAHRNKNTCLLDDSLPGPSGMTDSLDDNDDFNMKPTMVVLPAVSNVCTKPTTPPRVNRRSMAAASPAIAVIDRLLSISANNSPVTMDTAIMQFNARQEEADRALAELRELVAEKELTVHHLKSESKELKDRLNTLQSQVTVLEDESKQRLSNINSLNEKLVEKTQINKNMKAILEEYERTISGLIAKNEQEKKEHAEERLQLIRERDEQTAHLAGMEVSFSDLHSKYEKSKQVIMCYKSKEETYKKSLQEFEENQMKMQNNYELLKQHATAKLNHANVELEKINKAHEAEVLKLNAMIKRSNLHIKSLEESLTQKTKANEELTAICDELINKVG